MGVVIAGERSGVGKTTITLALLAALIDRGFSVQSFKVGPDYIDPMFHQVVTGRPCRNLDPILTSEAYVQSCFAQHKASADYAIVEGVMGLFDGAAGDRDVASTAQIARLLGLPVLLVLDCSRISRSVAAIVHGYRTFDSRIQVAGVILNKVGSDRHLELLQSALQPLAIPILGIFRRQDSLTIPDRHLGLIPTAELTNLPALIAQLADVGKTSFDWSMLLPLLSSQGVDVSPHSPDLPPHPRLHPPVRLAIARDRAFSFYYPDNLDRLTELGAELIPWSPLIDSTLPPDIQGLYLGGGFPEVFAAELSANQAARHAVKVAILKGLPTYAECGGLMYLCEQLSDFENRAFPMVGVLPARTLMSSRLTLGYRKATLLAKSLIAPQGTTLWGHEFHRSSLSHSPTRPLYQLQGYSSQSAQSLEGWHSQSLASSSNIQVHASYLHVHWGDKPELVHRFLSTCNRYLPASTA
jgi:cobyrinic acid a,c-diamide synthase